MQMNLEKNQLIKKQVEVEFIALIKSLKIQSNPPHPALHKHIEILENYLNSPIENTISISNIFQVFDYRHQIPKTKSRLCGGILKKGDRAYKCHECLNEDNSILCMQCFDLEKHKGHQFELIQVYGGCCDCGDPQKWNKGGFCKEHSSNQISDIIIDRQILENFLITHKFSFCLMLYFYQAFIQKYNQIKGQNNYSSLNFNQKETKSLLDAFKKKSVTFLEKYGCIFVNHLIEFNKNGEYANKMTEEFLKIVIDFNQFSFLKDMKNKNALESKHILSLFFSFMEFNKLPQLICDLFITLFQLRGFREILTIEYIQNYHKNYNFLVSNYTHLSSQLFTSYITISQIVQDKKIDPLVVNIELSKQEDVQTASQCYVRYYYDIGYLSKLYGDASIDYFRFHAANHAMTRLCDYRNVFNSYPSSIDYYGLDEIFISRMLQLVKVIQRDQSKFIFKMTLRDLYKEITSSQVRSDNYYRSHQRFFALLAFAYFEGDLSQLDKEENMLQFLATILSDNLQIELKVIVKRLCTTFSFAASLLENQKRTSDYYTFYSFYFKKTSNLFNLDSILIKIALKMCEFYNEHSSQTINFGKLIQNGDAFFDMYNKMINYSSNKSTMDTQREIGDPLDVLRPQHFKHFVFYLSLINEAITSDLPILAISCALQPKPDEIKKYRFPVLKYTEQAEHYYRNILKSCENSRISIKDFKMICDPFFVEEEIFKSFVNAHQDDTDKRRLSAQKSKGFKLSPIFYKSIHLKTLGIDHHGDMGIIPFFYKDFSRNIFSESYEAIWKSAQAYINLSQKAHQEENQGSSKAIISNLFNMIFTFLWTIYVQNKESEIGIVTLLRQQIKKYKLQEALPYLFKEIEKQFSYTSSILKNESNSENQSRQQKKKEKLLNKKQLLNQKMLKNKNSYLPMQSKSVEESQYICCICKQQKQNQAICYVAFSTITNYHGWLDLHQDNQFFLFTTCGHMTHRSCKEASQKGGKIYNFCHLCKKPTNIIIPKNSSNISYYQSELLMNDLSDIIKLFSHQQNIPNLLFRSIIGFLLFKGIIFPQYFVKQINIYSSILALLKKYYTLQSTDPLREIIVNQQCFLFKNSQGAQQSKEIFDELSERLFKYCQDKFEMNEKGESEISETASYLIQKMIQTEIRTEALIDIQFPLKQKFENPIHYKQFPQKLGDFSRNHLGKCENCGLVTNLQAICLICPSFITCVKCQKKGLNFHSENEHKKTCSFIKTNSGEIIYIYKNRHWIFESLYEDYMGRHYKIGQADKQNFQLNKKKLNEYYEDIITCHLQAKLRSKEKEFNKVNNDATL